MLWAGSVFQGRGLGPGRACQGPSIHVCPPWGGADQGGSCPLGHGVGSVPPPANPGFSAHPAASAFAPRRVIKSVRRLLQIHFLSYFPWGTLSLVVHLLSSPGRAGVLQ